MDASDRRVARFGPASVIGAAVLAGAAAFTPGFEGTVLHTYRDPAPRAIVTACTGHTGPELRMGMTFTPAECKAMLDGDLQKHWDGVSRCIHVAISVEEGVAYLDFGFNVGADAFCGSGLLRKLNAGDRVGACNGLLAWRYAGGKELPGLVRRRQQEQALCLKGATG